MNNKKYINVSVFVVVIVLGAGIAYYFYPAPINDMLGINSAAINAVSDADSFTMEKELIY